MKILVVSTPKTGNTWVKNLLGAVYGLPVREVPERFDEAELDRLGPRWVSQQHYYPTHRLLTWASARDVAFVTTVRHPADVFVSLYHYSGQYGADDQLNEAIRRDQGEPGLHVAEYVKNTFFLLLNQSISWMRTGVSHVVRYDDLWRDPVGVLGGLTNALRPVPEEALERAVERCSFDLMRKKAVGKERSFYRKGGSGGWREALPAEIGRLFREAEPYPTQFAVLGYRMEGAEAPRAGPGKPRPRRNPFHEIAAFDNGVPVSPIVVDLYLSLAPDVTRHWTNPTSTGPGSFYAWLKAPSARIEGDGPALNNIAVHVYESRPDLQERYPRLQGQARAEFRAWFLSVARTEYGLDEALLRSDNDHSPRGSESSTTPPGKLGRLFGRR
jgi:hypothetical protein